MDVSDDLLRRALEFALVLAQAGQRTRPPLASPPGLKPLLKFQKLPASALGTVRSALEADDVFRGRIGAVATEEDVGAIGLLWLTRPDGWEDEIVRLATEEQAGQERQEADRQERSAVKQVEVLQQALARVKAELLAVTESFSAERDKRQLAEARVREMVARRDELDAELSQAKADTRVARDQAASARRTLDETSTRLREVQASHEALSARLDEALAARVAAEAAAAGRVAVSGPASPAVVTAAASLKEAATAMARLAGALGDTAQALTAEVATESVTARPPGTRPVARRAGPQRVPISIPGGLLKDQPEVVNHLIRVPDVLVVVDGYNVAKTAWPDLALEAQRERLLDLLDDLVRRVPTQVHVVFDGADVVAPPTGRRLLHVCFSPPGVIADDVIREIVAELPPDRPVVVVTTDNAVVASVRAMGANTVTSAQFLAAVAR